MVTQPEKDQPLNSEELLASIGTNHNRIHAGAISLSTCEIDDGDPGFIPFVELIVRSAA